MVFFFETRRSLLFLSQKKKKKRRRPGQSGELRVALRPHAMSPMTLVPRLPLPDTPARFATIARREGEAQSRGLGVRKASHLFCHEQEREQRRKKKYKISRWAYKYLTQSSFTHSSAAADASHLTTVREACDLRAMEAATAPLREDDATKEFLSAGAAVAFTEETAREADGTAAQRNLRLATGEAMHTAVLGATRLRATTAPDVATPTAFAMIACIFGGV